MGQISVANGEVIEPERVHVVGVVAVTLTSPLAFTAPPERLAMALVAIIFPVSGREFKCGPTPVPCK